MEPGWWPGLSWCSLGPRFRKIEFRTNRLRLSLWKSSQSWTTSSFLLPSRQSSRISSLPTTSRWAIRLFHLLVPIPDQIRDPFEDTVFETYRH
jgi:hypothetical protein